MRTSKNNRKNAILAVLVAVAIGAFCLSTVGAPPQPPLGSARLVSMTQMPDVGDSCYRPVAADTRETSLFDAFEPTEVQAADTLDITRPPLRTIKDTYPIYSSIAVDSVRNEV